MCACWKDGYNPDVVVTGLEKIKSVSDDGNVSFSGWDFDDYATVLLSSLKFSSPLPDNYKRQIVHKAIFTVAKAKKLSQSALLQELSKLEQLYSREPKQSYSLVTDISLRLPANSARVSLDGRHIILSHEPNRKFQRNGFLELGRDLINGDLPKSYACVHISTSGRSPEEAGFLALDTIDLLRGMWNFYLNRKKHLILHSGKRDPINRIMLGPLHSLHSPNGKRLPDPFWYDHTYVGPVSPIDLSKDWSNIRRFEKLVRRRLSKSHSKPFLKEAFQRYARALDERSHETSFLKLWSLLEYLTRSGNQRYDVTIERAACLWNDHAFHKEILRHLRDHRNSAVHADQSGGEITKLLYQLKRYVEGLLQFHTFHGHKFLNLDEIILFLDLPTEKSTLTQRKRLIGKRLKFIRA